VELRLFEILMDVNISSGTAHYTAVSIIYMLARKKPTA